MFDIILLAIGVLFLWRISSQLGTVVKLLKKDGSKNGEAKA